MTHAQSSTLVCPLFFLSISDVHQVILHFLIFYYMFPSRRADLPSGVFLLLHRFLMLNSGMTARLNKQVSQIMIQKSLSRCVHSKLRHISSYLIFPRDCYYGEIFNSLDHDVLRVFFGLRNIHCAAQKRLIVDDRRRIESLSPRNRTFKTN